jgi:hypothetical protein
MNKTKSCRICNETFSCRQFINGKWRNLYDREHCLDCSPYKGNVGKKRDNTRYRITDAGEEKLCGTCQEWKLLDEFYASPRGVPGDCKLCTLLKQRQQREELKLKAITYLGGKCADCGLVDHPAVFDFHHIDPSQKDFQISHHSVKSMPWSEVCLELDKCMLLCANCHRKRHLS